MNLHFSGLKRHFLHQFAGNLDNQMNDHWQLDGMRMVERKQDALNTNFLIGLMDDAPNEQVEEPTLHVDVRAQPKVEGDRTLQHLASRIVEEVTFSSTPRQLATQVLNQAGIETKPKPSQTVNTHLRHVGQRAKKIPRSSAPKVRKVKRTSTTSSATPRRRGPPLQTRQRPAIGAEHETPSPSRGSRTGRKKHSRRGLFRR